MKKRVQKQLVWRALLTDEQGFSLVEILGALIILGIALLLIATLVLQNKRAIDINTRREEAIAVREDVKEWLSYKAQIQDIANLNPLVFTVDNYKASDMQERKKYLILDNSGIQTENGHSKYGEIAIDETDKRRGRFIKKVHYEPNSASFLPSSLAKDENNKLYMGQYLTETGEKTEYLVKVLVTVKENDAETDKDHDDQDTDTIAPDPPELNSIDKHGSDNLLKRKVQRGRKWEGEETYNPRKDGVLLTIQIYDQKSGHLLTETYLNWVVEF